MKEDMVIGKLVAIFIWVASAILLAMAAMSRSYPGGLVGAFSTACGGVVCGVLLWEIASCREHLRALRRLFEQAASEPSGQDKD